MALQCVIQTELIQTMTLFSYLSKPSTRPGWSGPIQSVLEYLQGCGIQNYSGQPFPVYTTVPCPVISAHIKSPSPSFYLSPFQALEGCSLQVSPRPSLLHVEQPQFSHPLSFHSQLMPVFGHSHSNEKELFSYNGVEFPIFKCVAFASYPVPRY